MSEFFIETFGGLMLVAAMVGLLALFVLIDKLWGHYKGRW